jgi:hypothetical protein
MDNRGVIDLIMSLYGNSKGMKSIFYLRWDKNGFEIKTSNPFYVLDFSCVFVVWYIHYLLFENSIQD